MRKSLGVVLAVIASLAIVTGGLTGRTISQILATEAQAASVEKQNAIDGTTGNYAVIAPVFIGTSATGGPQSYIRLFNGAGSPGSTSTFGVTIVGVPSGQTYGSTTNIQIPYFASIQYSIQEILGLADAGALTGGDTGYAVYLQNAAPEAGYQHAVYNWTTFLFENVSSCGSLLNEQLLALHNEMILTGVQTSKLSYPSAITLHNYSSAPATYTLTVYNAGSRTSTGAISSTSGKQTCQITGNGVGANSSLSIPESTIEANSACKLDSDESYMNVVVTNSSASAPPNAVLTHLVHVTQYNGDSNLTDTCAVNKLASSGSGTYYGVVSGVSGTSGSITVTAQTSATSGTITETGGSTIALSGTYVPSTNTITLSGGSYSFTGTVSGNIYVGTYTGPSNDSSGGVFALTLAQSPVTIYCATTNAPFNFQVSARGVVYGEGSDPDGSNLTILTGQVTGSSFTGSSNEGGAFTGTVQNGTISGTKIKGGVSKTFSLSTAACGS